MPVLSAGGLSTEGAATFASAARTDWRERNEMADIEITIKGKGDRDVAERMGKKFAERLEDAGVTIHSAEVRVDATRIDAKPKEGEPR